MGVTDQESAEYVKFNVDYGKWWREGQPPQTLPAPAALSENVWGVTWDIIALEHYIVNQGQLTF